MNLVNIYKRKTNEKYSYGTVIANLWDNLNMIFDFFIPEMCILTFDK